MTDTAIRAVSTKVPGSTTEVSGSKWVNVGKPLLKVVTAIVFIAAAVFITFALTKSIPFAVIAGLSAVIICLGVQALSSSSGGGNLVAPARAEGVETASTVKSRAAALQAVRSGFSSQSQSTETAELAPATTHVLTTAARVQDASVRTSSSDSTANSATPSASPASTFNATIPPAPSTTDGIPAAAVIPEAPPAAPSAPSADIPPAPGDDGVPAAPDAPPPAEFELKPRVDWRAELAKKNAEGQTDGAAKRAQPKQEGFQMTQEALNAIKLKKSQPTTGVTPGKPKEIQQQDFTKRLKKRDAGGNPNPPKSPSTAPAAAVLPHTPSLAAGAGKRGNGVPPPPKVTPPRPPVRPPLRSTGRAQLLK